MGVFRFGLDVGSDCFSPWSLYIPVKFLTFRTPEIFAVIYLKIKQSGQTVGYFIKQYVNGLANSEDPDQTAPSGARIAQSIARLASD